MGAGLGILAAVLAVLSVITRKNSRHPLLLVGLAAFAIVLISEQWMERTTADQVWAQIQARAIVQGQQNAVTLPDPTMAPGGLRGARLGGRHRAVRYDYRRAAHLEARTPSRRTTTPDAGGGSRPTPMHITVAHSPDSDDAFMFYGFACGAVAADGFEIDQVLADIESLNRAAFDGTYEVTAVSFPCLRAPRRPLCPAAARREHGGSLRADRRDAVRWPGVARRRHRGDPG